MKKLMLLVALLLLMLFVKAQHIEVNYHSDFGSGYVSSPSVWLDGDSIRFSFNVLYPGITTTLIGNVDVWLACPLSYSQSAFYFCDLSWTNANRPTDTEVIYKGAVYAGNFPEGEEIDIDYGALFDTTDGPLGASAVVSFRYYSY